MDTVERARGIFRFLVLIPHRDALKIIKEYRWKLFLAGYLGAFSFPPAAPLAALSRPFSREELKSLARDLREMTEKSAGKISIGGAALETVSFPGEAAFPGKEASLPGEAALKRDFRFLGPRLYFSPEKSAPFPAADHPKILQTLFPPVLCAALLGPEEVPPSQAEAALPAGGTFRAAALANLVLRPLEVSSGGEEGKNPYSFGWYIGSPVWLPARTKR